MTRRHNLPGKGAAMFVPVGDPTPPPGLCFGDVS
jgi:hypothetical protein